MYLFPSEPQIVELLTGAQFRYAAGSLVKVPPSQRHTSATALTLDHANEPIKRRVTLRISSVWSECKGLGMRDLCTNRRAAPGLPRNRTTIGTYLVIACCGTNTPPLRLLLRDGGALERASSGRCRDAPQ